MLCFLYLRENPALQDLQDAEEPGESLSVQHLPPTSDVYLTRSLIFFLMTCVFVCDGDINRVLLVILVPLVLLDSLELL